MCEVPAPKTRHSRCVSIFALAPEDPDMEQAITAIWYDLPEQETQGYMKWLHKKYPPAILQLPA